MIKNEESLISRRTYTLLSLRKFTHVIFDVNIKNIFYSPIVMIYMGRLSFRLADINNMSSEKLRSLITVESNVPFTGRAHTEM